MQGFATTGTGVVKATARHAAYQFACRGEIGSGALDANVMMSASVGPILTAPLPISMLCWQDFFLPRGPSDRPDLRRSSMPFAPPLLLKLNLGWSTVLGQKR
jgi:hypothetical protein